MAKKQRLVHAAVQRTGASHATAGSHPCLAQREMGPLFPHSTADLWPHPRRRLVDALDPQQVTSIARSPTVWSPLTTWTPRSILRTLTYHPPISFSPAPRSPNRRTAQAICTSRPSLTERARPFILGSGLRCTLSIRWVHTGSRSAVSSTARTLIWRYSTR